MNEPSSLPTIRTGGLTILVGVLWALFAALTWWIARDPGAVGSVEARISTAFHEWAVSNPWAVDAAIVLDVVGSVPVSFAVVVVAVAVLIIGGALRRPFGVWTAGAALLVASAAGAALLASLVKMVVDRPRPPWNGLWVLEESSSYPSGHAQAGISVYVTLGLVVLLVSGGRGWLPAALLFVLGPVIGLSRVVLGVHWPADVLGGWLLGAAWLGTCVVVTAMAAAPKRAPVATGPTRPVRTR